MGVPSFIQFLRNNNSEDEIKLFNNFMKTRITNIFLFYTFH